jgi:hypothetical protein
MAGQHLLSVFIVLSVWVASFCVVSGWGQIIRIVFRRRATDLDSWITSFWAGFVATLVLLQLWHLFLPVDWQAGLAFGVIGALGFIIGKPALKRRFVMNVPAIACILGIMLILIWVAYRSTASPTNYDSGLYHFNAIRWINEYAIVPGLGNLHGRLAFNQSYFLYVAMLNISPFFNQGHNIANSLLLAVLLFQLGINVYRALIRLTDTNLSRLFQVFFMPIAVLQALTREISSPSPDLAYFILGIVLIIKLIEKLPSTVGSEALFMSHNSPKLVQFSSFDYAVLVFLAAVTITIKLTSLVFGFFVVVLTFVLFYPRNLLEPRMPRRNAWLTILAAMILVGLPWLVRGVVTSGYLAYPSTICPINVNWRVPERLSSDLDISSKDIRSARAEANGIKGWARKPGVHWTQVLGNWKWFRPWLVRTAKEKKVIFPILLFVFCLPTAIAISLLSRRRKFNWRILLPFLPCVLGLAYWFFTAPDPRFAGSSFWIIGVYSLIILFITIVRSRFLSLVCSAILPLCLVVIIYGEKRTPVDPNINIGPNGFGAIPSVAVKEYRTRSGLTLYVPVSADQLWNSRLPSTPYPAPNIELRGRTLQEGFRARPENGLSPPKLSR